MAALTTTAGIPKYDVWRPSPSFTAIQNLSELALQGEEFNVSNRRQWSGNFHGIEIVGLSGIGKSTLTKYLFNDGEELPWIERATFDVLVYRKLQWGRTVVELSSYESKAEERSFNFYQPFNN